MTELHTLGGINDRPLCLIMLETGSPRSGYQLIGFLVRAVLLLPRGPLPAVRTAGGGRELQGLCLFHQDNSPTAQSPHPGPSLNLLTSSWALSPCTGTWGRICPHTKREDTNIWSLVTTEEKASGRRCDHRNYSTWIFTDNTRSTKEQDEIGYASDLSVHLQKRT